MDATANGQITQLTRNNISELTPTWSPDGQMIVFHRVPSNQLWVMPADGSALPVELTAAFPQGSTCWRRAGA